MTHRLFQWAPEGRQIAEEAPSKFVISSFLPVLPLRLAWVRQAMSQQKEVGPHTNGIAATSKADAQLISVTATHTATLTQTLVR